MVGRVAGRGRGGGGGRGRGRGGGGGGGRRGVRERYTETGAVTLMSKDLFLVMVQYHHDH